MYTDQFDNYNDPWSYDYEEIESDLEGSGKESIINDLESKYWKSYRILLSNYGLSKYELPIVYEMIERKVMMRLAELNKTLKEGINESYSLDDKKEFFYKYVAKTLFDTHTEVYEDDDGIYIVRNGISYQLISDCEDFQDVMSIPYNPRTYQVDEMIGALMSSLGVTNIEEQREVYQYYLDILKDKYCIGSPINESIDKEIKLFNMLVDNFIDNYYRVSINHDSNEFEPQLYYNDELFWFITISNLVIWIKNGIDWSLNGELISMHDFDDIFINYMVMYGIKDKKVIERFYDEVLRKLLDRVKEDIDKYENMGYDPL